MRTSNDRWTSPDRSVAAWRSMNGGGDPLLEHALVLLEAQDLGAQPPELAAQGVDVGDVVLEATSSSISAVGRLRAAVLRRTVIFSWAAQYFSRDVPGSPGRWTRARTSCPFLNV